MTLITLSPLFILLISYLDTPTATLDISLYTSIRNDQGLVALEFFFEYTVKCSHTIHTYTILHQTRYMVEPNNYFEFNGKYFDLISDVATEEKK